MGNLAAVLRFIEEQRSKNSAQISELRPLITGWSGVDAALGGKCHADGLHEWFGAARGQSQWGTRAVSHSRSAVGWAVPTSASFSQGGRPEFADMQEVGTAHPTAAQRGEGFSTTNTQQCETSAQRREMSMQQREMSMQRHEANVQGRDWSPPICILAHLAHEILSPVAQQGILTPAAGLRWAFWIGKSCFPYPHILTHNREDDESLLRHSVFVAIAEPALRLWAADLAVRCPAVGIVIVDGSRFPMAATRRLQLLARTHGKPILSARPPWERGELSAAQTRWQVHWQPGPSCIPRWSVELLRCKGLQPESAPRWFLERTRATGRIDLSAELAGDPDQAEIRAPAVG